MKREAKQEIRRVLMGRTLLAEDGRLVAMEKGRLKMPLGVADGAGAACFFGIRRRTVRLDVSCAKPRARELAFQRMREVGRGLYLPEQPEAIACLIRYVLTRPAVLVFDYQDEVPLLTAWAGRGLTGWISNRRAIRAFVKQLPKGMTLSDKPIPEDNEKAERKKAKQEKKQAKREKKAAEKQKKQEKKKKQQERAQAMKLRREQKRKQGTQDPDDARKNTEDAKE